MPKRRKKEWNSNNTKLAISFFILVFGVVIFSLIIKGISIVRQSKFDSSHRFTISISNGKNFEIVSFSPMSRSISVLKLNEDIGGTNIQKLLAVYTDGEINSRFMDLNNQTPTILMWRTLINFNKVKTNLTIFDALRLLFFSKIVPVNEVITKNFSLNLTTLEIDKITASLFTDKSIEKDNKTIEVVNGTDVAGLGNWFSRLLTNIGCNIVLVSTSDSPVETSTISYFGKKTYTVERLEKILGFKTIKRGEQAIADIIVLVGKDDLSHLAF